MFSKQSKQPSLLRAHDVVQEHWYIAKTPCACGGHYRLVTQQLSQFEGKSMDVMNMACKLCEKPRKFLFDISPFHGDDVTRSNTAMTQLAEQVDNTDIKQKLMNALEPPVVLAMQTIMDLRDKGDRLALDWLLDAIQGRPTGL